MPRGFVLQPTYRIEHGRPVVLLYGRLEHGPSFLVRDTTSVPHFWVRRDDVDGARRENARIVEETRPRTTMLGEPVARVEVSLPRDVPPLRDRLRTRGIATFEADVRFAYRFLIDRGIRGSLEITGPSRRAEGVDEVFDDPAVAPAEFVPALSVLSLDIETDPQAQRLLSIGLHGSGASEVLLLTRPGQSAPAGAVPCSDERELLLALVRRVREIDPDVLTGWNVVDFDLAVLSRIAEKRRVALTLGRGIEPLRLRRGAPPRGQGEARIEGRLVLDGIDLLRGAFVKVERYSLESVSRAILGKGKTIHGSGRAEEILATFERDRTRFVEYNLNDARLVIEILEALHLIELAVERSRLTGMPPDRVGASIASFDFLYLSKLSRLGLVAPTVDAGARSSVVSSGGHVLEPLVGLYRNVVVLDFKSLYPSVIRTFQIDPLGHLTALGHRDSIRAPNGALFRREPGILPGILDRLVPRREAARASGNRVASQAIKILMNSFYGVLGTPACRFASPELANAITGFGRELLLESKRRIEQRGHRVLYGDTDSLFVLSDLEDTEAAGRLGRLLAAELTEELSRHVREKWDVESRLELQFERLYLRLVLPAVRHGSAGARKRYAGLVEEGGNRRVVFTGLEVVRSDWTELARRVQRELYERLFSDRPVEQYLRETVRDLRAGGELDELLVYRKSLRKGLAAYSASAPHVVAARRLGGKPPRVVSYVVTESGPEPATESHSPLDHEHYVQKQLRAVAEPVLALLGLDFDRVIGDDKQLSLF